MAWMNVSGCALLAVMAVTAGCRKPQTRESPATNQPARQPATSPPANAGSDGSAAAMAFESDDPVSKSHVRIHDASAKRQHFTATEIVNVFAGDVPELARCYTEWLARGHSGRADVQLQLHVQEEGRIMTSQVNGLDNDGNNCIQGRFMTLRFPEGKFDGVSVVISFGK